MEEYPFTKQDLVRWKEVHAAYAPRLSPNRKTAAELLRHLKSTYVLTELFEPDLLAIVTGTIEENEHYRQKLPHGAALYPRFFRLGLPVPGKNSTLRRSPLFMAVPFTSVWSAPPPFSA
ncbi:MAG: hypothetical protein E7328_05855 [Clostridiales bacterium]|nr:hypothetical protein [Clostridiales bacterium]